MRAGASPTKAIGECAKDECGDVWVSKRSGYAVRPSVTCEPGFVMTGCNIYSPWKTTDSLENVYSTKSQVQSGGKTVWKCQSDADCPNSTCIVDARCLKPS
ncbi:uncharacterized protein LOC141915533 [Tubulanus polymorphus]|uniref:uncharacterized protein LOC141915533 n=1 Tax=Tubulanus polymorphus TaxID=672921 RepID=UPI003DA44242